jgi:hypothetical protein
VLGQLLLSLFASVGLGLLRVRLREASTHARTQSD